MNVPTSQPNKPAGLPAQNALAPLIPVVRALEPPESYDVRLIPSGCCGTATSFGYEAEILFDALRNPLPKS